MTKKFPSAIDIVNEAYAEKPKDINELHKLTFEVMLKHRSAYYEEKVDEFLNSTKVNEPLRSELRTKMLTPMKSDGIVYSNFMEEASRRISQVFQPISGNIAELCVEFELQKVGLELGMHYSRKKERTDFIVFYPDLHKNKARHRLEVKNVKLRERGTRGLAFDGDSLIGFFNDPKEFTKDNVRIIDEHCKHKKGYCYIPPNTLSEIKCETRRFRSNLEIAKDMFSFVKTGKIK